MSDNHQDQPPPPPAAAHPEPDKREGASTHRSERRLTITVLVFIAFTVLTLGTATFYRGVGALFIASWVLVVVGILAVSIYFTRYIITAEKQRD